jgi:hypothetical protein
LRTDLTDSRRREVGTLGALLMGPDGAFITGSDFLIDGGVTASYFYGDLASQ